MPRRKSGMSSQNLRPPSREKLAGGKEVQKCRIEAAVSLPQLKGTHEHGSCPKFDRTLERLGQRAGVEGGSGGRQVCLLGFSHTMNQVKLSAPDGGRLKAEEFTDPNETAGVSIRRQEPSARTSFQGCFRRGEIIER